MKSHPQPDTIDINDSVISDINNSVISSFIAVSWEPSHDGRSGIVNKELADIITDVEDEFHSGTDLGIKHQLDSVSLELRGELTQLVLERVQKHNETVISDREMDECK